tara:strand:+ start:75892 stop:78120 length:2229 start_codon:yes stop_codon:yes gene_type:complete
MSYIINNSDAFINIKLTENGRQKLAQGQLNFASWAIGDSEINYDRELLSQTYSTDESLSASTRVQSPFDRQPNIKHFVTSTTSDTNGLNTLTTAQVNTIKAVVSNCAEDRGFFSKTGTTYTTQSGTTYVKSSGVFTATTFNGGTTIVLPGGFSYSVNDYILIKLANDTVGTQVENQNAVPVPHLWYKIQASATTTTTSDTITLDRALPNIAESTGFSQYIIYHGGEVYTDFGFDETTPYWNSNTLAFQGCCDVSVSDVPVWNMNNVWCENLPGMTGTSITDTVTLPNESYEKFGSNDYTGQILPYFGYCGTQDTTIVTTTTTTTTNNKTTTKSATTIETDPCISDTPGASITDPYSKSISILHYTNNTISNFYGEYFFIDGDNSKNLYLRLPDLMYHRRDYSTESGVLMGMDFVASGETQLITNTEIEFVDLIEDPSLVSDTPRVVGKVFPQLKIVIFGDDEIVAALSYKSNRSWTLPPLSANLITASGGTTTGLLQSSETMYLTYVFEGDGNGLQSTLPCQNYTKITNSTSNSKDVQFKINDVDLLPYMRKEEKGGYDGMGFSAKEFKVLYQILPNSTDRPVAGSWKVHDYTSTAITSVTGETIDPVLLENQNPIVNGFLIDTIVNSGTTTFSIIESLTLPLNTNPDLLTFGDERFFYGNIETYIGATIYKSVFNLTVASDEFKTTENPTRDNSATNPPDIRISELGIYDNTGVLVMTSKLSRPIRLKGGNTVLVELSMDF